MLDTVCSPAMGHEHSTASDVPEVDTRSVEELEEEIAELCAHIDAATYRLLRAIAEFDRREAWPVGFQSTAHWLSWKVGIDMATAREKVRVARALEGLPQISEAFRQGKMSYSKVRAMTRIATPESEGYLLYIAENGTTEHVESVVRGYRRATRGDGVEGARRQREERYLEMYTDEDGMVVIRGRLPQEIAALVEKALEAAMDALKEEERKEGKDGVHPGEDAVAHVSAETSAEDCAPPAVSGGAGIQGPHVGTDGLDVSAETSRVGGQGNAGDSAETSEDFGQCEVQASAEVSDARKQGAPDVSAETSQESVALGAGGLASRSRCSEFPGPQWACGTVGNESAESRCRESLAQRRVDALGLLAEAALGKGLGQTERGEPYQVMIHVDSAVLADRSDDGLCELDAGEGISAETCRRLACDAPHVTVGENGKGNILDIGRKARKISKPLWRALMSRDRTCRFPGCTRSRHLQAHHIEHWAKGGETNPDNIALLCRAHHWAVHEGGVRVEGRVPHGLLFHLPDGSVLPACPVRVPISGEAGETLKQANRGQGLEITANTVDSFWDGQPIDLHMAVDALLTYDDDSTDED